MAGHTENTIVVPAPIELVWDVTNDLDRWTSIFTEYAEVEVIDRQGDTVQFRITMHPDEQNRVWSWISERTMDWPNRTVTAKRVETGPFEFMHIHWKYDVEPDGSTRMTWAQDFHMKPDAPVNDQQMTDRINKNTKIQMEGIRDRLAALASRSA